MTKIIQLNATGSDAVLEISGAKRRQIHNEARALFAEALVMGVRLHINRGAALHNIKTFQTYKVEGFKSWGEYCDAIGIDRSNAHKYTGIARALLAYGGTTDPENHLITKQEIDGVFKQASLHFKSLTFQELYKASQKLDVFSDAMNGVEIVKLLPPADGVATDDDSGEAMGTRTELAEWNEYMREVCRSRGWKWNTKEQRCEHPNGDPITDEELGQITPPKAATRVWEQVELQFTRAATKIEETILHDGKAFIRYQSAIRNDEVAKRVSEFRESMRRRWLQMDMMLENLMHGDEARVKEIYKHGVEEV